MSNASIINNEREESRIIICIKFLNARYPETRVLAFHCFQIASEESSRARFTLFQRVFQRVFREISQFRGFIHGIVLKSRLPRNAVLSGSVVTVVERSQCPAGRNSWLHLRHVSVGAHCMIGRYVNIDVDGFACSFAFLSFFSLTLRTNKFQNR